MRNTAQKTQDPKVVRREGTRLDLEDGSIVFAPGAQTATLWEAAPALLEALKRLVGNADQYLPEWDEARAAILLAGHTPGHHRLKPEAVDLCNFCDAPATDDHRCHGLMAEYHADLDGPGAND